MKNVPKLSPNRKINSKSEKEVGVRINKYLADAGICSRRAAEDLVREGVVKINREVVSDLGRRVLTSDFVTVRGEPVTIYKNLIYILLNKPKDYITTTNDEKGRKTVMDIVRKRDRIFPVGRLDRNTTGALLLTNDGDLAYRLTHPSFEVPKVYNVVLDKKIELEDARKISEGIELEDGKTSPCEVLVQPTDRSHITLELHEGRNREVRRIFESLGYEVKRLDRKSFATLSTRGLARGEYRHLTRGEILQLRMSIGLE